MPGHTLREKVDLVPRRKELVVFLFGGERETELRTHVDILAA